MVITNEFKCQTDSDTIEKAIQNRSADGIVIISPRESDIEPERKYWLIDRAILIPENTTIILQNCKIKLSDRCRDNFFRSANCGIGIDFPEKIQNIHIRGEGLCILEGADHPRSTGDASKRLQNPCPFLPEDICKYADYIPKEHRDLGKPTWEDFHDFSYGTDCGKEGESQYGDWRNIGILFANAEFFSISNLRIVESHGWGISMEACSNGSVSKITFDARMFKEIDGILMNIENQDGVNLRNGCHHITVSDISGQTGDDVIALTAIARAKNFIPGGSMKTTHVMHNDYTKRERNTHDIIIRNVTAHSFYCYELRLLVGNTEIYNVIIDGVIDVGPTLPHDGQGTLVFGDYSDDNSIEGRIHDITVSNCICGCVPLGKNMHNLSFPGLTAGIAIGMGGDIKDSSFVNVINKNPNEPMFAFGKKKRKYFINAKKENFVNE